jgi:lipopolysaccharide-induced tumor necrosis factor-alpha factor
MYVQPTTYIQPLGGFLSHYPQAVVCMTCRQQVVTIVQYEPGGATWLIALLICFFGGILGCCLIPFCVPSCQDAVHTCPSCHNQIGRHTAF